MGRRRFHSASFSAHPRRFVTSTRNALCRSSRRFRSNTTKPSFSCTVATRCIESGRYHGAIEYSCLAEGLRDAGGQSPFTQLVSSALLEYGRSADSLMGRLVRFLYAPPIGPKYVVAPST